MGLRVGSIPSRSHSSPDQQKHTHTANGQIYPRSLDAMATLQPKGSIISRTSFAALDVEEPESEEEPEVVELSPAQ
jgi:hypothetical protein